MWKGFNHFLWTPGAIKLNLNPGGYRLEYADYEQNKLWKTSLMLLWRLLRTWEIITGSNPDKSIPMLVLPKECNVFDFHSDAVIRWRRDKNPPQLGSRQALTIPSHSPLHRIEPYSSLNLICRCLFTAVDDMQIHILSQASVFPGTNCFLASRLPWFSGPSAVPRQCARMAACHVPNIFCRLQLMSGKTVSYSAVSL